MSAGASDFDPVDDLIDAFLERHRRGERPSLTEYTDKYPELAERIRAVFPALLVIEEIGSGGSEAGDLHGDCPRSDRPMPERLGDYLLVRRVGSGGMGIVYEAIQESLGRHVALKTLPDHHFSDATRLERFRREARAAARLHHTHIVPVYGIGEHDGLHYYTMQFIRGHGLEAVLKEVKRLRRDPSPARAADALDGRIASFKLAYGLHSGRFPTGTAVSGETESPIALVSAADHGGAPEPTATSLSAGSTDRSGLSELAESQYVQSVARIGAHVALALEYAHQQGILHRDIKPANLLLDAQGEIWITDFGLAKAEDSDELTRTGDVVGTLKYMAPERFSGWSDRRSDVYALGATLYELLTLRPAFDEADRIKLIERIVHQSPAPLRQVDPRISRDLETIVLRALAKEPGERYPTAGHMAEDLRRFALGRPILARRSGTIERSWRWSKRNPLLAGATVAVAAALLAVAVLSLIYAKAQSRASEVNRNLADKLTKSLADSNRLLAIRNFDRGQTAFEKDQIGAGLLWMVESWRSAVEARDPDWQHAARANLAAWGPRAARLKAVFSHPSPVDAAAFSPDGKIVVTGGDDGTARLWDVASGQPIGRPLHHPTTVFAVVFSHDGKTILTGCGDGAARLWDLGTGQPVGSSLRHEREVLAVAFSPDGRTILTGSGDETARLWDTRSHRPIGCAFAHQGSVKTVTFSPDGKSIATGSDLGSLSLWDAASAKPIGLSVRQLGLNSVAYSPDGKTVLAGSSGGMVHFWDTTTRAFVGKPIWLGLKVRSVAFSPDGKSVLTGCEDKVARLWDTVTHQPIGLPLVHQGPVVAVAFSPDGKLFLTASSDNTVRLWDAEPCQPFKLVLKLHNAGNRVTYSPDGKSIFTGHWGGTARHWDASTGLSIGQTIYHAGSVLAVAISPDGSTLLTGSADKTARLWNSTTGSPVGPALEHGDEVSVATFSPDGKTILTGGEDRMIRLWDALTGTPIGRPIPQSGTVDAAAFSPDGKSFVVGYDNGSAQLWNLATKTALGQPLPHPGCISAAAFSPDGNTLLTGCEDGAARLWDVETRALRTAPLLHHAWIWAVAFSPDGKIVLTGSRDQTARLWDAATGMPLGPQIRHPQEVAGVAFSPDGNYILTGAYDYVARLYRKDAELPDDLERVAAWVAVLTGLRLDARQGTIRVLDNEGWLKRREQLEQRGGPPDLR